MQMQIKTPLLKKKKKSKRYLLPIKKLSKNLSASKKKQRAITKMAFHVERYTRLKTHNILGWWVFTNKKKKTCLYEGPSGKKRQIQIWTSQKRLRFLRRQKKSKLPAIFFEPWKKVILHPTRKQHFLNAQYNRYKNLRLKDRLDFFQTYIGKMLLATEIHSQRVYKDSWYPKRYFLKDYKRRKKRWQRYLNSNFETKDQSLWKTRFFFSNWQKKSWWYENLVQKRAKPQSAKKFALTRPATAFQLHWKQRKKEPWKEILLFRRALYAGFGERLRKENRFRSLKMKPYLRRKNPRSEKRNQLYQRTAFLLANYKYHYRIFAKKHARIKQLVRKIIWPFHGHLRIKQMTNIYKKSQRIKSKMLSRNEIILSHFENRLDVVVYRLNLAPTILWARRLIQNGAIFVVSANNTTSWERMHASLKKIAFPLKLRDPKKLYSTSLWTYPAKHWATFRFLSSPQKKISYLLQAGDLIQCASGNSLHQFKTKAQLWHKPIPTHLLTKKQVRFFWEKRSQKLNQRLYNTWEQPTEHLNAAVFLHAPRFADLNTKDRIKESFFRWTML